MRNGWVLLLAALAPASLFGQACPATTVGFRVATIAGLKTAVWYPATAPESAYVYGSRAGTGSVALNAAPATCARLPLVVFSHGFGGCGIQSVFITEQLARKGYIVAAPDHKDAGCSVDGTSGSVSFAALQEPFRDPDTWTDQTFADRKNDIQNLITALLVHPEFGGVIDSKKIAGMGHSLGGYTMFGLVGGWPSWKDARITAAVLLSPYIDPFTVHGAIPRNTVPTMYQGGVLDLAITPSIEKAGGVYDIAASPKFFVKFPGGHLTWTNSTCDVPLLQCLQTDTVAQGIDSTILSFLDHYLNGMDRPDLWFRSTDATVRTYRRSTVATSISAASFETIPLPPMSVGTVFGEGLVDRIVVAQSFPLPTTLGGLTARITDASGRQQNAGLYFVSQSQVNFLVPAGTAEGNATVDIRNATDTISTGNFRITAVAPALFSVSRDGRGTPAGQYIIVRSDGSRADGFLFTDTLSPMPLNVNSGQVYVVLYGTGFRSGAANSFTALVGNQSVPILAVAPSPEFPGLDQIAIGPLPASLAGAGTVQVTVSIAGNTSNALSIVIQ